MLSNIYNSKKQVNEDIPLKEGLKQGGDIAKVKGAKS